MDYFYVTIIATIIFAMITMVVHTKKNTILEKSQIKWFVFTFILVALGALCECGAYIANIVHAKTIIHTVIKVAEFSFTVAFPASFALACKAKKSGGIAGIIAILHAVGEIVAARFNWIIAYDVNGNYEHGPFYFVYIAVYVLSFLFLLITLFSISKQFGDRDIGTLIGIVFTSLVCFIPTFVFDNVRTAYLTVTMIVIIFYLYYVNLAEQAISEEVNKAYHTIERLSIDYEVVLNANISTEAINVYTITPYMKKLCSTALNSEIKRGAFSKIVQTIAKQYVDPEVYDDFMEFMSPDNLRNQLAEHSVLKYDVKTKIDGETHYFSIKIAAHKDSPNFITLGIVNADASVLKRLAEEEKKRENNKIIEVLASEYSSVYYIDLKTLALKPYAMNEDTEKEFGKIFRNGISYQDAYSIYVDNMVYEPDKEKMLYAGSVDTIKKNLADKKAFVTVYRVLQNGIPKFCEMKFVKVDADDAPATAVALGFADRDNEITARFIDSKLREECASVYLADIDANAFKCVRSSEFEGFETVESGKYDAFIESYSTIVDDEYKQLWADICNGEFLRNYLGDEDRKEIIYTINTSDHKWRRAVFHVVARQNGLPTMVCLVFLVVDDSSAEKFELNKKIEQQKNDLLNKQTELEFALGRAEAANKAKTVFLSNMSHDIRTPMNAIIGFTNLALQNLDSRDKIEDYLTKTSTSGQHLLSLINDILDMSRIESGKLRLEEVDCNLSDILHDLHTIVLDQARSKRQNLYFNNINVTDENVVVDKLRLHQVLINILSNAIKFTPVGGDITVCLKQLSNGTDSSTYEFRVKDTGIGMSPEFKEKIFEPFERERTSTISGTQGTGLGMSITKKIVDLMGGTISVESEQGKGSEFIVVLKLRLQSAMKDLPLIEKYAGGRVLIIDDDRFACEGASTIMNRLGMKPEWTLYGKTGILQAQQAALSGKPYSLFFVDWLVPDTNGLEIIKTIRNTVSETAPIVVMTSYDASAVEEEAIAAGATCFLSKPIFYSEVYDLLSKEAGERENKVENDDDAISFAGKRVLLVEDNELNREIAQEVLEDYGFVVDTAEDGIYAVEKIRISKAGTYDLVLMDIQMPIMDGYTATRNIRALENNELANIPIIAMTANAFVEDKQRAMEAGMNEHIAKPIDVKILCNTLKKFLL